MAAQPTAAAVSNFTATLDCCGATRGERSIFLCGEFGNKCCLPVLTFVQVLSEVGNSQTPQNSTREDPNQGRKCRNVAKNSKDANVAYALQDANASKDAKVAEEKNVTSRR